MISVQVDRDSPVPLYFQIAQQLEQAIDGGALPPGQRLENELELSERLAVSRPTLRRAIERLVDQGLLVRRRGVGTVVVPRRVRRPVALSSLHDDLIESGRDPVTRVLTARTERSTSHVADALCVPDGSAVLFIERLRYADDIPLAVMHNYLPDKFTDLTSHMLECDGLYQLLRRRGVQPRMANQTIGARAASAREVRLLNTARGATVLTMSRTAFGGDGEAVEYGSHAYLAERYSFEMSLVAR